MTAPIRLTFFMTSPARMTFVFIVHTTQLFVVAARADIVRSPIHPKTQTIGTSRSAEVVGPRTANLGQSTSRSQDAARRQRNGSTSLPASDLGVSMDARVIGDDVVTSFLCRKVASACI